MVTSLKAGRSAAKRAKAVVEAREAKEKGNPLEAGRTVADGRGVGVAGDGLDAWDGKQLGLG